MRGRTLPRDLREAIRIARQSAQEEARKHREADPYSRHAGRLVENAVKFDGQEVYFPADILQEIASAFGPGEEFTLSVNGILRVEWWNPGSEEHSYIELESHTK